MRPKHRILLGMLAGTVVGGILSLLASPWLLGGDEPLLPLLLVPSGMAACALFGARIAELMVDTDS